MELRIVSKVHGASCGMCATTISICRAITYTGNATVGAVKSEIKLDSTKSPF